MAAKEQDICSRFQQRDELLACVSGLTLVWQDRKSILTGQAIRGVEFGRRVDSHAAIISPRTPELNDYFPA